MKHDDPLVSVIILNYNGKRTLEAVIQSVRNQSYSQIEIIVVDNASPENDTVLLSKLSKKYDLIVELLEKNLGFAGGNNVGIRKARGEYIALLNNDCVVSENWLQEMVNLMKSNAKIAAVNSKILLYPFFFVYKPSLGLSDEVVSASLIDSQFLSLTKKKRIPLLKNQEHPGECEIEVPCLPDEEAKVEIEFEVRNGKELRKQLAKLNIKDFSLFQKIQNTGIVPFASGYCRDVGAHIESGRQDYETERGQYDKPRRVYSCCAAAVLYRRSALERCGLLNEKFFMYYEDVELSERLASAGLESWYAPKAAVRHIHAASSDESSQFFAFQAERGRFFHIILHYPLTRVFYELGVYAHVALLLVARRNLLPMKVVLSVIVSLPSLLWQRLLWNRKNLSDYRNKSVKEVTTGYWLSKRAFQ